MGDQISPVLDHCADYVRTNARSRNTDTTIRACWEIKYALGLSDVSFTVPRDFVVLQTSGFGSCHFEGIDQAEDFSASIGRSALDLADFPVPYRVAGLDAVASAFNEPCSSTITLRGSNREKVLLRSKTLYEATKRMAEAAGKGGRRTNVVMMGALSGVLGLMAGDPQLNVTAIDRNPHVVGREYHGIEVLDGGRTIEAVASSDVVLITGMSLLTDDLNKVLELTQAVDSKAIMYMQTGAHLARPLLAYGADLVLSEEYPFYFMGPGDSIINVRTK